ncbi:MAG: type IV pilus biogenesis/stability protein PilW [Pseudomonadota bacterium]|nr:type IV pilus biogenesis/stability protein PilW [Pseudomonadota bacterium]
MNAAPARSLAARLALCLLAAALSACAGSGGKGGGDTAELKTASDQTPAEKRAAIRLQLAIGYFQDGKLEVALDEVKQAIAVNPAFADAYGVRALIYSQMGEHALAEENYQRALKLAPRNPELSNNYGSFLCQHGRGAQGIVYLEAALKNPTYQSPVKALLNAGSCSLKMKQLDAAERYLLDALRYEPDHPATNANLARVYYERRDYQRAGFFISRVRTAAKLESLSADDLWLAVRIDRKLGDKASEASMGTLLRRHHPGSPEYAAFQRGAFDE